jgi:hypothetical protein
MKSISNSIPVKEFKEFKAVHHRSTKRDTKISYEKTIDWSQKRVPPGEGEPRIKNFRGHT